MSKSMFCSCVSYSPYFLLHIGHSFLNIFIPLPGPDSTRLTIAFLMGHSVARSHCPLLSPFTPSLTPIQCTLSCFVFMIASIAHSAYGLAHTLLSLYVFMLETQLTGINMIVFITGITYRIRL